MKKSKSNVYSIIKFIDMLNYTPLRKVHEPTGKFGCEFISLRSRNHRSPSIEYGIDGRLYFEIIDFTNYHDGDVIPVDSSMREVVVDCVKLTDSNASTIADVINTRLHTLYATGK